MSPSNLTFGRKTEVIEQGLRKEWYWGRRNTIIPDEHEQLYEKCFPPANKDDTLPSQRAKAMTGRRRERMVLDSLLDLIRHMEAMREGRTAVITVSDGWKLFRPDPTMMAIRENPAPRQRDPIPGAPPPVGVGPGGALTSRMPDGGYGNM